MEGNIKLNNKKTKENDGHIINLKDLEKLKTDVNYNMNKNKTPSSYDIAESEKMFHINELDIKTSQYLTNMILNGNKYIIVDNTFWKIICEKGKKYSASVCYKIDTNNIILTVDFKDGKPIKFNNSKQDNILEESNLKNKPNSNLMI